MAMANLETRSLGVEDRAAMRDSFRRLLADHGGEAEVRRVMDLPSGYDQALWRRIADLGVVGLIIDPQYGGIGAGPEELELIMEEAGAFLLCAPLVSSGVLAAGLLQQSTDEEAKARLLPPIASGQIIATAAMTGPRGLWTAADVAVTATEAADGWALEGEAGYVTDAAIAQVILVVAKTPDGLGVFEVDPGSEGLKIFALDTFDRTLRLSGICFSGTKARRIAGAGALAVEQTLDLARIALAGEQAGGARRIFDITLDYTKSRVQFGRPIGGFQAIKHMAADLLLEAESATSAAREAARALAESRADAQVLITLAAFACADAFCHIAATAIQMHGGIAFTWSHPAHLYLRRARADAQLLGTSAAYRERYVTLLETAALTTGARR